jgi:hypothetical protein
LEPVKRFLAYLASIETVIAGIEDEQPKGKR